MNILSEKKIIIKKLAEIKKKQLLLKIREEKKKIINALEINLIERSLLNVSMRRKELNINININIQNKKDTFVSIYA